MALHPAGQGFHNRTVYIAYTRAGCIVREHFVSLSPSGSFRLPPLLSFRLSRAKRTRDCIYMHVQLGCIAVTASVAVTSITCVRFATHANAHARGPIQHSSTRPLTMDTCVTMVQIIGGSARGRRRCVRYVCTWINGRLSPLSLPISVYRRREPRGVVTQNTKSFGTAH